MNNLIRTIQKISQLNITSTVVISLQLVAVTANPIVVSAANSKDDSLGGIQFHEIVGSGVSGLDAYRRIGTPELQEKLNQFKGFTGQISPLETFIDYPIHPNGQPGLAILDFDGDGDQDMYVTNGPGRANSLFENRLIPEGHVRFEDIAAQAGVELSADDSTGVCYGDLDNDGDQELLVLVRNAPNHLFNNEGNGRFSDISGVMSGFGTNTTEGASNCQLGDVNEDGLLDIHIGNTFDWLSNAPVFGTILEGKPELNSPDELFINLGDLTFSDSSDSSGIRSGENAVTWAAVMWDYDGDGHLDIVKAQDINTMAILKGDGKGHFTDVTAAAGMSGLASGGDWMGIAVADYNGDGTEDMWVTNFGTYTTAIPLTGRVSRTIEDAIADDDNAANALDLRSTKSFVNNGDGSFTEQSLIGNLEATPFGWGIVSLDYDNNSCHDVAYFGGLDWGPGIALNNPGVILNNANCDGNMIHDPKALDAVTDYGLRVDHGVATGDFNLDGFADLAIVASAVYDNPNLQTELLPCCFGPYGGPFDNDFLNAAPFEFVFPEQQPPFAVFKSTDFLPSEGGLSLQINGADNSNNYVTVELVGMKNLTPQGQVNRNGFGAHIWVKPQGMSATKLPVLGGSSHASQNSSVKIFGLGSARYADIEIEWPNKIRNRLGRVRAGTVVKFPEIPCSIDDTKIGFFKYFKCVRQALSHAVDQGFISRQERTHFLQSALFSSIKNRQQGHRS